MRKLWPGLLMVIASAAFSAAMYHRLPETMVSHWGAHGEPNGWTSRLFFVVSIHAIALFVAGVLAVAPQLDPKRYNFDAHESAYWLVGNSVLALVALGIAFSIAINVGMEVHINWMGYGVGALFIVMGNVMTRIRQNWIFGVRTPWTLSSEKSWREAHRVAGYGSVIVGIAVLVTTAIRPNVMVFVLLPGVIGISLAAAVRSYIVWKNDPTVPHPK